MYDQYTHKLMTEPNLCHYITQWLHIFLKVLQLLINHCSKNTFDLTLLFQRRINILHHYNNWTLTCGKVMLMRLNLL